MSLWDFVAESNRIEGITRDPTGGEMAITKQFLDEGPTVAGLELAARVYAGSHALLREHPGMNVRVGSFRPIPGGPDVRTQLGDLVANLDGMLPHEAHVAYEMLHPFMDGNGRSGRLLWLWMMGRDGKAEPALRMGFLHVWYYQSLAASRPARPPESKEKP